MDIHNVNAEILEWQQDDTTAASTNLYQYV